MPLLCGQMTRSDRLVFVIFHLDAGDSGAEFVPGCEVVLRVHPLLARLSGHCELWPQSNRIHRTGFLAKTTEHTAQDINLKTNGKLFDLVARMLTRFDVDALGWTGCGAEKTSCAAHLPIVTPGQKMFALEAIPIGRRLFGPLQRLGLLFAANPID